MNEYLNQDKSLKKPKIEKDQEDLEMDEWWKSVGDKDGDHSEKIAQLEIKDANANESEISKAGRQFSEKLPS